MSFADWDAVSRCRVPRRLFHRDSQRDVDAFRAIPIEVRAPNGTVFVLNIRRWDDAATLANDVSQSQGLSTKHENRLREAIVSVQLRKFDE